MHSSDRRIAQLNSQLYRLTEQYLSYPVLQYYHAARAEKSPAQAVEVLDDGRLSVIGRDDDDDRWSCPTLVAPENRAPASRSARLVS